MTYFTIPGEVILAPEGELLYSARAGWINSDARVNQAIAFAFIVSQLKPK